MKILHLGGPLDGESVDIGPVLTQYRQALEPVEKPCLPPLGVAIDDLSISVRTVTYRAHQLAKGQGARWWVYALVPDDKALVAAYLKRLNEAEAKL